MGGSTLPVSLAVKRPFFDDSPNLVGDVNMFGRLWQCRRGKKQNSVRLSMFGA